MIERMFHKENGVETSRTEILPEALMKGTRGVGSRLSAARRQLQTS
jgi:hypothetical protein